MYPLSDGYLNSLATAGAQLSPSREDSSYIQEIDKTFFKANQSLETTETSARIWDIDNEHAYDELLNDEALLKRLEALVRFNLLHTVRDCISNERFQGSMWRGHPDTPQSESPRLVIL
jgi:hypothetical protein